MRERRGGEGVLSIEWRNSKRKHLIHENQVFYVLRDQFRYTLETGKNESWSGFELFQLYFFAIDCPWLRTIGSFLKVTKIDTALPI